jgi:hypothetical protein
VCIVSFAIFIVAALAHSGGLRPAEGLKVFWGTWAGEVVISSPLPAYYYWQGAKTRKSYRIEVFFVALAFLTVLCGLSSDPFLVFAAGTIWIVIWFAKCRRDWRINPDQSDSKKAVIIVASMLVLACSIPILAAVFFKERTFSLAMTNNHFVVARCLVWIGADPNALDVYGQTPLREAAWDGSTRAVSALLSMGAKADLEAKAEFQGLMPSGTALAMAAAGGRGEICNSLLVAGADPNKSNQYGTTPLLAALSQGSPACAPVLIEHGANVNARDALGETPLMLIARFDLDHNPVARHVLDQLLARDADVLPKDNKGQTAEDWAVLYHSQQLAMRLHEIKQSIQKKQ